MHVLPISHTPRDGTLWRVMYFIRLYTLHASVAIAFVLLQKQVSWIAGA